MARIATEKEKYIDWINNLLKQWIRIEDITAKKLQWIVWWQYSRNSLILEEFKKDYQEKVDEKNKIPQAIWFDNLSTNISESINDNLNNAWIVINNEMMRSINKSTDDFEVQRKIFESQRFDDSKQIEKLEIEIEELKKEFDSKDSTIAHLKKNLTITLSDSDRFKNEVDKLKAENSNLIKSVWMLEWKMQMKDELIKKLEKK